MRAALFLIVSLSFPQLSVPIEARAQDRACRVVVALAPPGASATATGPGARLAQRFAALGLTPYGTLADGIAPASPRATSARGTSFDPFGLDPARILLFAAADSIAAHAALDQLASDPGVAWAEPDQLREPTGGPSFPNDPLFVDTRQWGLRNVGPAGYYGGRAGADIHVLGAWQQCVGSNDVLLGVADTGIDPDHPDLGGLLPDGRSRIAYPFNATTTPTAGVIDSFGHGTLVVGVMAARTHDGPHFDSLGIAGVCGGDGALNAGCRIVPIKITRDRSGETGSYEVARALLHATNVGVRALNLSFAGQVPSRVEREAMYYALVRGCVLVAAAGNRGFSAPTQPQYPAAYAADGLGIQVGASDQDDRRTAFSSYGPGLDFLAPGVDIWTTFMTFPSAQGASYPGYVAAAGTSLAAPFGTGAVGLLAAARPELIDTDFQHVLRESADDLAPPGIDAPTGWGRLNAARALEAVRPSLGIWHDEIAGTMSGVVAIDTLRVGETGPGTFGQVRLWPGAEQLEVTAQVAFPDSFLDSIRVWPRLGGTSTVRGGFRLPYYVPWATIAARDANGFTMRGYLYRTQDTACGGCDAVVPLPTDQARFGFTVIGRVDRAPTLRLSAQPPGLTLSPGDTLAIAWEAHDPDVVSAIEVWLDIDGGASLLLARVSGSELGTEVAIPCLGSFGAHGAIRVVALDEQGPHHDRTAESFAIVVRAARCASSGVALAVAPNPARGPTRIAGPAGSQLTIVDLGGRRIRRATLDHSTGTWLWDGLDERGRRVPPGVYLVRLPVGSGVLQKKVVRLD